MTSGVLITLTICTTIILLFGTIMIAAVVLNKQKKQDDLSKALRDPKVSDLEHDMIIKEERDNK